MSFLLHKSRFNSNVTVNFKKRDWMLQASPFGSLYNSPVASPRTSLLLKLTLSDHISHRLPPLDRSALRLTHTSLNTHTLPYSFFPVRHSQASKDTPHTYTGVLWGPPHARSVQFWEAETGLKAQRTWGREHTWPSPIPFSLCLNIWFGYPCL